MEPVVAATLSIYLFIRNATILGDGWIIIRVERSFRKVQRISIVRWPGITIESRSIGEIVCVDCAESSGIYL